MGHRVLWIDEDDTTLLFERQRLELAGYRVCTARTGHEARGLIAWSKPDIALIGLTLPDESGVELLRLLRSAHPAVVCIIVASHATCRATVDAMRLGAFDVIEKPLHGDTLVELVRRAAVSLKPGGSSEQHAFGRWAELVVRGVASPTDPRTLEQWGRAAGASRGALRSWCQIAGIPPRQSLLFTRLLRAVSLHEQTHAGFEQLLEVVDRRTLVKLAALSGGHDDVFPCTVEAFLAQQRLVTEPAAVEQLTAMYPELLHRVERVETVAQPADDAAGVWLGCTL